MAEGDGNFTFLDPLKRYVPLAVWLITILVILFIPLKIIQYGYLPADDALRHAAKAVSDKSWSEILVLNDTYKIDHEFGWDLLLEKIHAWGNLDAEKILIFSIVFLFVFVSGTILPWLKRPEAWLVTILAAMIASDLPQRFILGRPYLITLGGLISILLLWQRHGALPPKLWMSFFMMTVVAASTFFHGVWYLWSLLIAAFFFAGQFRWSFIFAACCAIGVLLGAAFTGHPIDYPLQALKLAFLATGMHPTVGTMALELQPTTGDCLAIILFGGLLILRKLGSLKIIPLTKNPAFWLICICWALGFKIGRFWEDWGWPALMVLVVFDVELLLLNRFTVDSFKRLGFACGLAVTVFLAVTCDANGRWSSVLTDQYLSVAEHPSELKGWMPDKGGIFYSADMRVFYQTFYKNPRGDWRYMLGFEPTWMPKEDFETYHKILWNSGDAKAYTPWIKKMQPADRLIIRGGRDASPNIPQLEWNYGVSGIWVGRLPRKVEEGTAPPTIPATSTLDSLTNSIPEENQSKP